MFPPLDPLGDPNSLDLGVGPAPQAPTAPTYGESPEAQKKRRIVQLVAAALAAGLGPGKGTGLLQGMSQAHALNQREQQIKDQQAAQLYQQQHQDFRYEQQQYEQEQQRRQQLVATNLDKLRTLAPTLKSKDEYDRYIDAFSSGLQGMGVRVNPNYLRTAVPYTAPDGKKEAATAVESFLKNPANKDLIADPMQLAKVRLKFDRDGDGMPELVPLLEAADIGGIQFAHTDDGSMATYPAGTSAEQKSNADGYFTDYLAQAKAEGKAITPELRNGLRDKALKRAKEAQDTTPGPTPGSFEDYLTAPPDRKAEIERARKGYNQADDKPTAGPRERYNVQPITLPDGTTGLVRVNMDTGDTTRVELPEGASSGRATDTQRLSAGYYDRTQKADVNAKSFESKLSALGSQFDVQFPNLLKSEAGQLYSNAKDEFINAALRRESGAAIQPSEYERFNKIYFVVPGDRPSVIRQKQEARQRVIDGFKITAGNLGSGTTPAPVATEKWIRDAKGNLVKQGTP